LNCCAGADGQVGVGVARLAVVDALHPANAVPASSAMMPA